MFLVFSYFVFDFIEVTIADFSSPARPVSYPARPFSYPARPFSYPARPFSYPARPFSYLVPQDF